MISKLGKFFPLKKQNIIHYITIIIDVIEKIDNIINKTYETNKKDIIIARIKYFKLILALHKY